MPRNENLNLKIKCIVKTCVRTTLKLAKPSTQRILDLNYWQAKYTLAMNQISAKNLIC